MEEGRKEIQLGPTRKAKAKSQRIGESCLAHGQTLLDVLQHIYVKGMKFSAECMIPVTAEVAVSHLDMSSSSSSSAAWTSLERWCFQLPLIATHFE